MKFHYGVGGYKRDVDFHLSQTDHEIAAAMRVSSREIESAGHASANAILKRGHFRPVYHRNPSDEEELRSSVSAGTLAPMIDKPFTAGSFIYEGLINEFGSESLRTDTYSQKSNPNYFPVLMPDGRAEDSVHVSAVLANIPLTTVDYIFASRESAANVLRWIDANRDSILKGVAL